MAFDLSKLSTTPASNDQASFFQTGMRPSAVKTAGWNLGSIIAQLFNSLTTGSGSANAQTLTNPVPFTSLSTGLVVTFKPGFTNTGATTFAPDGLAAKNVFFNGAALVGGELQTNVPAELRYDGTQWNLLNTGIAVAAQYIISNKYTYYADSGAVNALVITPSPAISAYADGQSFVVKVANTTTNTTPTINVNGLGAKNILSNNSPFNNLDPGQLTSGNIYRLTYDSASNGFICENPSMASGSFTLTLTGMSSGGTGTVNYRVSADQASLFIWFVGGVTGTSNAATMTGTGMPAIMTFAHNREFVDYLEDNGIIIQGLISISTSTWTFGKAITGAGGFTTSGTKGINSPNGAPRWAALTRD